MAYDFAEGEILLFDKPYEWSSFDIVRKVKLFHHIDKIGHAGTLDPLATGLLILCTGKMTKKIIDFQDLEKEYEGEMVLGKTTPSFDRETEVDQEYDISGITNEMILNATLKFVGATFQYPPIYSARKVDGVRLYKKARRGELVKARPRDIYIKQFEITGIELPTIKFKVTCSKGTYIRSLAKDFGESLGAGAYLSNLRRTRIGTFHVNNAHTMENFVKREQKVNSEHEGLL
jgi:tRNA pseudouridine55 synthase